MYIVRCLSLHAANVFGVSPIRSFAIRSASSIGAFSFIFPSWIHHISISLSLYLSLFSSCSRTKSIATHDASTTTIILPPSLSIALKDIKDARTKAIPPIIRKASRLLFVIIYHLLSLLMIPQRDALPL